MEIWPLITVTGYLQYTNGWTTTIIITYTFFMMVEVLPNKNGLILTVDDDKCEDAQSFTNDPTEFGTDNCALNHIWSILGMFTTMCTWEKIGVRGVNERTMAAGISTIPFTITDDENVKHTIVLHNVIYLPEAAKNLISTTKWSEDKQDDCGILSRGRCSIFMWNNNSKHKRINYPPNCNTPLMTVNENNEAYVLFNSTHSSYFLDETLLMYDGVYTTQLTWTSNTDQQSTKFHSRLIGIRVIPTGSTVWYSNSSRHQVAIVTKYLGVSNWHRYYTIFPLSKNWRLLLTHRHYHPSLLSRMISRFSHRRGIHTNDIISIPRQPHSTMVGRHW